MYKRQVESVGTVALGRDTHLSIDVETLVVAQVKDVYKRQVVNKFNVK